MPHKDREARLAYLRAWKLRNRPPPVAIPQGDPALPPLGQMTFSEDGTQVQCHACGRWFGALNTHIGQHDLDARSYKAIFGLPRTASLLPPATKAKQREAALARGQGDVGRQYLTPTGGRPAGQEARLGVRIEASDKRRGVYTRGGNKARPDAPDR